MGIETGSSVEQGAWGHIVGKSATFKHEAAGVDTKLAVGDVTLEYVIYSIYRGTKTVMDELNLLATTPGLDAWVADFLETPGYVATTEVAALTAAQQLILSWIDTNAGGLALTGDTAANALQLGSLLTDRFATGTVAPLRTLVSDAADLVV